MGEEVSYKPLIQDFTWSYSRLTAFEGCKWQFFLKYIRNWREEDTFYASYGSFMHHLLDGYYSGEIQKDDLLTEFLLGYKDNVVGRVPKNVSRAKYMQKGIEYLSDFKPLPFDMIACEQRINFDIEGIPFVGIIDYIGEKDGELVIVDHKSRELKPRSGRSKPTANDLELDKMLRQLYLYAHAANQEYGKLPKYLCFNCFKNQQLIIEPFVYEKYEETLSWVLDLIRKIEDFTEFSEQSEYDYHRCNYLCGLNRECDIWLEERGV